MWFVTRILITKRKNQKPKAPEPGTINIESMLEGAEFVACVRNESLFLTTEGKWLFVERLEDRLNYSTLTPWKARNFILTHMIKKDRDNYNEKKTEILMKYNLKGGKKKLHDPHVEHVIQGKVMIKNRSKPD
jgi:hypothetical protein